MSDANQQSKDKLDMQSPDLVKQNIEKLAVLFPNCLTETVTGKAIDFDLLKQELNHAVVEGNKERYRLEWPGKREAIVTANLPTTKTLRPVREDSVDFDNTENIYIEGDNLEVLKLLQESYLGKIKMIYIDPPYNTGNDFVYNDNFAKNKDEDLFESGQKDELNQRLVVNPETSGRYHSDWLNMIYPRLKLARNLLKDDGVIFISIDDNELTNLKKLCDEIFGEINFICQFIVNSNSTKNNAKLVSISHEYALVYGKSKETLKEWEIEKNNYQEYSKRAKQLIARNLSDEEIHNELLELVKYPRFYDFDHYTYADSKGVYRIDNPGGVTNGNMDTEIIHPVSKKACKKPEGGWRYKHDELVRLEKDGYLAFGSDENFIPSPKRYLSDYQFQTPKSNMYFDSQSSTKWLKSIKIPFDFAKSTDLISHLMEMVKAEEIVLDFFAGSSTTAHSALSLNAKDGKKRNFILVQVPQEVDLNSDAGKLGFKTICDMGKERIRRAAKKIKEESGAEIDYGFRVYRLDESNMQDLYYRPQELDQSKMDLFGDNVKPDRTEDDLLAQVMLDWGLPLSLKIEQANVAGKKVFKVADNSLFACFDNGLDETFAKEIAKDKPLRIVFKDAGFKDDTAKTNVKQLLKQLSPETEMKVL